MYPADKVLVCGGRDFTDKSLLYNVLDKVQPKYIIHGGARGADYLGGCYARDKGIPYQVYPANWDRDRKAAGPIRNQRMLDDGKPTMVVAFPGGHGTAHMVSIALKAGVPVLKATEGGEVWA